MSARVIIVEDEPEIAAIVVDYLKDANIDATIIDDGTNAVESILSKAPDLVLLDVMLPGKDGLAICREVRAKSDVPIIVESARVEELDRLIGLELGADDYICKPFSPREVVARVKAVLRRSGHGESKTQASQSRLLLDGASWTARVDGKVLDLTRREFELLSILTKREGRVFSRAQLLELAFPDDAEVFDRTIDSHVKNIRKKSL